MSKTQTSHFYYTLHGKAVSTGTNPSSVSPGIPAGTEVDICWSTWYGMGGYSEDCWQANDYPVYLDLTRTKELWDLYRNTKTLSGYGFHNGHLTEIRKHTVTTIIETETEVIENV